MEFLFVFLYIYIVSFFSSSFTLLINTNKFKKKEEKKLAPSF